MTETLHRKRSGPRIFCKKNPKKSSSKKIHFWYLVVCDDEIFAETCTAECRAIRGPQDLPWDSDLESRHLDTVVSFPFI
jgi:hypothetical protein